MPVILHPPYDRRSVWHRHFFAPDGRWCAMEVPPARGRCPDGIACRAPEYERCGEFGCYEVQCRNEIVGRYDAVEDALGRIFVWKCETEEVVVVCRSREEASRLAQGLATI